jgi:hypothetical protein
VLNRGLNEAPSTGTAPPHRPSTRRLNTWPDRRDNEDGDRSSRCRTVQPPLEQPDDGADMLDELEAARAAQRCFETTSGWSPSFTPKSWSAITSLYPRRSPAFDDLKHDQPREAADCPPRRATAPARSSRRRRPWPPECSTRPAAHS